MLTEKQFEGLKKVNLSVDTTKSRDRISSDFKEASTDIKKRITDLSGLNRASFYNAFQRGSASPKMVLAMSQLLGVSPYYYTGESEDKGEFNEEILENFIAEKKLFATAAAAKRKPPAAKKAPAARKAKAADKPAKAAKTPTKRGRKPAQTALKPAAPAKTPDEVFPPATAPAPAKRAAKSDEVIMQISIEKTPKLDKAVANLDEETAVLLFRALIRKADASEKAKTLCDVIKSCLLS